MKSPQLILVVDADIAGAAGPDPKTRPWSDSAKDCRDTLEAVRRSGGYRVVFDANLWAEWLAHQGNTAKTWLADMVSKRRVVQCAALDMDWIEVLIEMLPEQDRAAATKDRHLVALADGPGDKRILSNDGRAREKFARIDAPRVGAIHWVATSPDAVKWLRDGAADRVALRLG